MENQELHLVTSLTRTLGEKVSGIVEMTLKIIMESWMGFCYFIFPYI